MKAVGRFVLLEEMKGEETSSTGIMYGKTEFTRFKKGKLVSDVGDVANAGDVILYDSVNSHKVRIEGQEYVVLEDRNIAVIL